MVCIRSFACCLLCFVFQVSSVFHCDGNLGLLCFYCDIISVSPSLDHLYKRPDICHTKYVLKLKPRDAFRRKLFLSCFKLLIQVDGAYIEWVEVDSMLQKVTLSFSSRQNSLDSAYVVLRSISQHGNPVQLIKCRVGGKACSHDPLNRADSYLLQMTGGTVLVEAYV